MDPAKSGTLIADRYRLVRPLGAGSSATVWEAADTALDRTVAVKLLHGFALADPTERERLRREARALARLAHPRITIVFDYLEQTRPDGTPQPVLVTELLHGATLADRLRSGPLPAAEAVAVCAQLADALRAAHQAGIVHRDVKPANVVLTGGGVKLLDFGIALAATDSKLTGSMAIGTPACMAPEQLTGRGAVPASDVYALGCVMYWCLTGHPPYESPDVTQVAHAQVYTPPPRLNASGLPPGLTELYLRCMAKEPGKRPNAAEVFGRLSQMTAPHAVHPTLVMPPVEGSGTQGQNSGAARPANGLSARQISRLSLLIGALAVAAAAAGITALLLSTSNSANHGGAAAGSPTAGPALSGVAAASSSANASPVASVPGSAAGNPIAYLEAMRGQIDGFIARGQGTIDPNTGRDLQNSLADLENAISTAQHNHGGHQLRSVLDKVGAVEQKVSGDVGGGKLDQSPAATLTGELQQLSNALPGVLGDDG